MTWFELAYNLVHGPVDYAGKMTKNGIFDKPASQTTIDIEAKNSNIISLWARIPINTI
jgi:hypothetical protein